MKKLFTIFFCLLSLISLAQKRKYKGVVSQAADAYNFKSLISDTAFGLARYNHKLDTSVVKYLGRKGDALMFADTLAGIIYWYNPHTDSVDVVNKAANGSTIINNFNDGGANTFNDTIKYPAEGNLLDIAFYTPGKYVTFIQVLGENGTGFLRNSGTYKDSTHVYYDFAPDDTVTYIFSGIVVDTNVLEPPTGLIATPLNTSQVQLAWNNSLHNNGYQIDFRFADGTYTALKTLPPDDTTFTHSGLPPDTLLRYRVRTLGDSVYFGSNFSYTNATTAALVILQTPLITATANSTSQITVNVGAVPHASAYELLSSYDGINFAVQDTLAADATTKVLDSLSSNTYLVFKARALAQLYDSVYTNSDYSDTVSATTFTITPLATPTITIDSVHSDAIYFHWQPSAGASSYLLLLSNTDTTYNLIAEVDADTTSYVLSNLSPTTTYYLQVGALADSTTNSNSDFAKANATTVAEETTVAQLATPSPITATVLNASQVRLQWTNVANETGYKVAISPDRSVWTTLTTTAPNTTSYTVSGLQPKSFNFFRVFATADEVNATRSKATSTSATTADSIYANPITTVHGALISTGNTNNNYKGLDSLGLHLARNSYTGTSANYPNYTAHGFRSFFTYSPAVPGLHTDLPTDSAQFACTLDSMLTENGTDSLEVVAIINEPNNLGVYWFGDASNTLNLFRAATTVIHAHGLPAVDGGITGPVLCYKVWEDYKNRGYMDSAADYAARAFPPGTNLTNWRNTANYGYKIRYLDTLLAGMDSIPLDYVNCHWYETARDVDSNLSATNPLTFIQTARYLSRVTGKPVITNEYGLNNNTTISLMQQQVGAVKALHMKYAIWYSDPTTGTLVYPNATLTPLGEAYKLEIQKP